MKKNMDAAMIQNIRMTFHDIPPLRLASTNHQNIATSSVRLRWGLPMPLLEDRKLLLEFWMDLVSLILGPWRPSFSLETSPENMQKSMEHNIL